MERCGVADLTTTVVGQYAFGNQPIWWGQSNMQFYYGNGCLHNPIYYQWHDWYDTNSFWGRYWMDFPTGASCQDAYAALGDQVRNYYGYCNGRSPAWIQDYRNSLHVAGYGNIHLYPGDSWCVDGLGPFHQYEWGYY